MRLSTLAALAIGATFVFSIPAAAVPAYDNSVNGMVTAWQPIFSDNFNQESGRWIYPPTTTSNSAIRTNGYVKLTSTTPPPSPELMAPTPGNQAGVIWFDTAITSAFQIEFDFLIGGGASVNCVDGMVFMFYKDKNYLPGAGGRLGFVNEAPVPGYGVEFDTFYNGAGSVTADHVGIIKDHPYTSNAHLANVADPRVRTNTWQHVKVIVDDAAISVYLVDMNTPVLTWTGAINRAFGGFGFGAGTTSGWTDNHQVDNVIISKKVVYMVDDGAVVGEVQGEALRLEEQPARESGTWTMLAGNTAMLAIAILVVVMLAKGIQMRRR